MGGCFFVLFSGRLESLSARMDQHRRGGRCNDCPRDAGVWWRFLLLHEALFKHDPPIALLFGFFLFYLVFLCLLCCWFNFWAKTNQTEHDAMLEFTVRCLEAEPEAFYQTDNVASLSGLDSRGGGCLTVNCYNTVTTRRLTRVERWPRSTRYWKRVALRSSTWTWT